MRLKYFYEKINLSKMMHIYNSKKLSIVVEYIPGQAPYKNESLSTLDKAKYRLQQTTEKSQGLLQDLKN